MFATNSHDCCGRADGKCEDWVCDSALWCQDLALNLHVRGTVLSLKLAYLEMRYLGAAIVNVRDAREEFVMIVVDLN